MFEPRDIIELLAANLKKTRNPFGVPNSQLNAWWRDQPGFTRRPGAPLLFTGLMYQAIPYIEAVTRYLERLEDTPRAGYLRFGSLSRYFPSFLLGRGFSCLTSRAAIEPANAVLHAISRLLKKSGVDFFYHPEMDFYSGILLYDLGDQEGFVAHARYVARTLRLHRVEKIITVDPHTTYALQELYPKYTGETFEVQPYFSLLRLSNGGGKDHQPVAIHDPCFYGRYLKVSAGPRQVLKSLGVEYQEVRNSGEFTSCCGGPAESVSPALNREILDRRVAELKASGAPVVTMCPICLANLLKAGLAVEDLASLASRYG